MYWNACCCNAAPKCTVAKVSFDDGSLIWQKGYMGVYDENDISRFHPTPCFQTFSILYEPIGNQLWIVGTFGTLSKLFTIFKTGTVNFTITDKIFSVGEPYPTPGSPFSFRQPAVAIGGGNICITAGDLNSGDSTRVLTYDLSGELLSATTSAIARNSPINKPTAGGSPSIWPVATNYVLEATGSFAQLVDGVTGTMIWDQSTNGLRELSIVGQYQSSRNLCFADGNIVDGETGELVGPLIGGGSGAHRSAVNARSAGPGCVALTTNSGTPTETTFMNLETEATIVVSQDFPSEIGRFQPCFYMDGDVVYVCRRDSGTTLIEQYNSRGQLRWSSSDLPPRFSASPYAMTIDDDSNLYIV